MDLSKKVSDDEFEYFVNTEDFIGFQGINFIRTDIWLKHLLVVRCKRLVIGNIHGEFSTIVELLV